MSGPEVRVALRRFLRENNSEVQAGTSAGLQKFRAAAERALTAGGLHLSAGGHLWTAFRCPSGPLPARCGKRKLCPPAIPPCQGLHRHEVWYFSDLARLPGQGAHAHGRRPACVGPRTALHSLPVPPLAPHKQVVGELGVFLCPSCSFQNCKLSLLACEPLRLLRGPVAGHPDCPPGLRLSAMRERRKRGNAAGQRRGEGPPAQVLASQTATLTVPT